MNQPKTDHHMDHYFNRLLDFIKHSRGFDFSGYKHTTLVRRIQRRMEAVGVDSFQDYQDYLEVHPDEFALLFDNILINVTGFLRDPSAWDYLRENVIPELLERRTSDEYIRIWSAGCATGEEAFTIAILMVEAMGAEAFRRHVKIYATDMDEEALHKARIASYTEKEIAGLSPELVNRYFEKAGNNYIFRPDLRRSIIFGQHDLIQDAPISRIDLLVCRNVLMYFNVETQTRVLSRLHFALKDNGFLLLGRAEMLVSHSALFTSANLKQRLFTKVSRANNLERLLAMSTGPQREETTGDSLIEDQLRDLSIEHDPVATLVLDPSSTLILANKAARKVFSLTISDIGKPFQDLRLSYQPIDLRSSLETAIKKNETVLMDDVRWMGANGEEHYYNLSFTPLMDLYHRLIGTSITFIDITDYKKLQVQLENANQELETAMEELESTNEELETTNEELQSTIEELETTNEELQSTNEELETMNEELQSTNEELETMNDEMNQRSDDLSQLNLFLNSILSSLRSSVVVLDRDQRVQVWSTKAEDLWGMRQEEVLGRNFFNLDIGLPVEKLREPVRDLLDGNQRQVKMTLDALNRRGRNLKAIMIGAPLLNDGQENQGVILLIEPIEEKQTSQ